MMTRQLHPDERTLKMSSVHYFTHEMHPEGLVQFTRTLTAWKDRKGKYYEFDMMTRNGYTYYCDQAAMEAQHSLNVRAAEEAASARLLQAKIDRLKEVCREAVEETNADLRAGYLYAFEAVVARLGNKTK